MSAYLNNFKPQSLDQVPTPFDQSTIKGLPSPSSKHKRKNKSVMTKFLWL